MWNPFRSQKRPPAADRPAPAPAKDNGAVPSAPTNDDSDVKTPQSGSPAAPAGGPAAWGNAAPTGTAGASARSADAEVLLTPGRPHHRSDGHGVEFEVRHGHGEAHPDVAPHVQDDDLPPLFMDDQPMSRADRVGEALERWALQVSGGHIRTSFLTHMRGGENVLDLTHSHPSGLAQLLAGRGPTRLSSLVREVGSLAEARIQARAIRETAERQAEEVGLTTCHLGIGEASWSLPDGSGRIEAPILVRPITLRLRGNAREDVDLEMDATVDLNPYLLRALRDAGITVDARALLATTSSQYGFDPTPVLDALKDLGQPLPGFRISYALVVGNLMDAAGPLTEDLSLDLADWSGHPVVAALAGDPEALAEIAENRAEDAPPLDEHELVSALDPDEQDGLARILAGEHVALATPPGAEHLDLVMRLAAELNSRGKRVLVLSQRRDNLLRLRAAAEASGMSELVFDLSPDPALQRNATASLLKSLRRAGSYQPPMSTEPSQELIDARDILSGHVAAMHRLQQPWKASAHDAISELAALARLRPAPRTTVRLKAPVAAQMVGAERQRYADALREAGEVGLLSTGPEDTAWYGAPISSTTQADRAEDLVTWLYDTGIAKLEEIREATGPKVALRPASSFNDLLARVQLLRRTNAVLDTFHRDVFSNDLDDMVTACADKSARPVGTDLSFSQRRRLKKQAKSLVRGDRAVMNLHGELVNAKSVLRAWRQVSVRPNGVPKPVVDLRSAADTLGRIQVMLDELKVLLDGSAGGSDLDAMTEAQFSDRIAALYEDRATLDALPRRTTLLRSLVFDGLGDLVEDLRQRRVAPEHTGAELELAWWRSVLELIAGAEPTLSQYSGTTLSQVAERYRRLDREYMEGRSAKVRATSDDILVETMKSYPDTSRSAIAELARSSTVSVRDLAAKYEDILFRARPTWLASPYLVSQIVPRGIHFDVVLIADGGRLPAGAAMPGIVRSHVTAVLGDPLDYAGDHGDSIMDVMMQVGSVVALRRDPNPAQGGVRAFAQRRSPVGEVLASPSPVDAEPDRLVLVDGRGPVTRDSDYVESTEAELRRVTDLVIEHARTRPNRSLAVLTLTPEHARRVMARIMQTIGVIPSLREYFDPSREEFFTVLPAEDAARITRDEIIVSIGFGKTPHGRLLHRFGPLSGDHGRQALASVLTRSRGRTTVVSSIAARDLAPDRLKTTGAKDLRALLNVLLGRLDEVEPVEQRGHAPASDTRTPHTAGPMAQSSAGAGLGAADPSQSHAGGSQTQAGGSQTQAGASFLAVGTEGTSSAGEVRALQGPISEEDLEAALDAEIDAVLAADAPAGDVQAGEAAETETSDAHPAEHDAHPAEHDADPAEHEVSADTAAASDGAFEDESFEDGDGPLTEPSTQDMPKEVRATRKPLETDALLHDLADRLWRHGLIVEADYGLSEDRVELALGHPELPGQLLVAVETDGEAYVDTPSQRERDRLRAERLERAGWFTERVWSWSLFMEPEEEAARMRRAVEQALIVVRREQAENAGRGPGGHRLPRPAVPAGHPLHYYSSEDFDAVVEYLASDGRARLEDQLAAEVRGYLGFDQRTVLLDVSISSAIRRYQERQ